MLGAPGCGGQRPAERLSEHLLAGPRRRTARGWGRLLAVLSGLGDVPRVGVFCDGLAHLAIAVGGEEGSRLDEEAEAVVKGVPFLWPVFREEAVAQRVIAHHVLDLQGPRPRDLSPASRCSCAHTFIQQM